MFGVMGLPCQSKRGLKLIRRRGTVPTSRSDIAGGGCIGEGEDLRKMYLPLRLRATGSIHNASRAWTITETFSSAIRSVITHKARAGGILGWILRLRTELA